jgi:hypothetical protein
MDKSCPTNDKESCQCLCGRLQTKAVLRLMKAKLLIETVVAAEPFQKKR